MARMHKWLISAALGLSLTGCVTQEKYNAMKLSRDQLADQLSQAEADDKIAKAEADAYKNQLDQIASSGNAKDAMLANEGQQLSDLKAQLADIKAKYEDELNRPPQLVQVGGTALPAPLSNALSEFAAQNPDLVEFDAARGIVKFKSDVTFAPGSIQINDRAKDVLGRFAQILNSPAAVGYELMVAGHTDNTPIVRRATMEAGHYDNWYLSVHRAIAVGAELVRNGVSKTRLGVAGYADQRPIASNATEAGKAQNRRVEIMILPTTARGGGGGSLGSEARTVSHHTAHRVHLDKDSASADEPAMSK